MEEPKKLPKDDIDWDHTYECGCRIKLIYEIHSSIFGYYDWHWSLILATDNPENW